MIPPDDTALANLRRRMEQRFGLKHRSDEDAKLLVGIRELAKRRGVSPRELVGAALEDSVLQLELAGPITVEESYFFRHPSHMGAIRKILLDSAGALASRGRAGSGRPGVREEREPYTVAMIAKEISHSFSRDRLEILGTDLSSAAIVRAAKGSYGKWSLRETSDVALDRYFTPDGARTYEVKSEIRRAVRFGHGDLLETAGRMTSGSVDLILFRNVSIYLTKGYLQRLYEEFFRVLKTEGYLLMSATDALPPKDLFRTSPDEGIAGFLVPSSTSKRDTAPARPRVLPERSPKRGGGPNWEGAAFEGNCRKVPIWRESRLWLIAVSERALAILDMRLGLFPEDFDALLLRSQISLALAEPHHARDDLEKAVELNPGSQVARYWLALSYLETGERDDARGQVERILSHNKVPKNYEGLFGDEIEHRDLVRAAMNLKEHLS